MTRRLALALAAAASAPAPAPAASPELQQSCMAGYVNIPAGSGTAVQDKKFRLTAPSPDTAPARRPAS